MLIKLDKSLVKTPTSKIDQFADLISCLHGAHSTGQHFVYSETEICNFFNQGKTSETYRRVKVLNKQFIEFSALKEKVEKYIVIKDSKKDILLSKNGELVLSFDFAYKYRQDLFASSSHFICENPNDGQIYLQLTSNLFSTVLRGAKLNLNFVNGGGHTTASELERIFKQNKILLCVVDSDKNCPKCDKGKTASFVEDSISKLGRLTNFPLLSYKVLDDCREIENLFKYDLYHEIFEKKRIKISDDFRDFMRELNKNEIQYYHFLDLKKGVVENHSCAHLKWKEKKVPNPVYVTSVKADDFKSLNLSEFFNATASANHAIRLVLTYGVSNSRSFL